MDTYYVVIKCENTSKGTRTGIEVSSLADFDFIGRQPATVVCPHCKMTHTWTHDDAWLEFHPAPRPQVPAALALHERS